MSLTVENIGRLSQHVRAYVSSSVFGVYRRAPHFCSQPAGDVSHKLGGRRRLPLLSARPAVTLATLKRAATIFAAW